MEQRVRRIVKSVFLALVSYACVGLISVGAGTAVEARDLTGTAGQLPMESSGRVLTEPWFMGQTAKHAAMAPDIGTPYPIGGQHIWTQAAGLQELPAVAFDGTNYLAVWDDPRGGIFGARVSQDGDVLDSAGIEISNTSGVISYPVVAFGASSFLVLWQVSESGQHYDICGARVDSDGSVLDPEGIVVAASASNETHPDLAFNGTDYLAVWQSGSSDIYGARIGLDGQVLDPLPLPVCVDSGDQDYPAIAAGDGVYLVVWDDTRSGDYDVYGIRTTWTGAVLDSCAFPIAAETDEQRYPDLAFDGGNFLVTYKEGSILAKRVSLSGAVIDSSAINVCGGRVTNPALSFDGVNYLVSWQIRKCGLFECYYHVYGGRVTPAGDVLDPDGFEIAHGGYLVDAVEPSVVFGGVDYLVVWQKRDWCQGTGNDEIYAGRVGTDGEVRDPQGIDVSLATNDQRDLGVASNGSTYLAVWQDNRAGGCDLDIYGSRISMSGDVLDSMCIQISTATDVQQYPAVAAAGSGYLVVWYDERTEPYSDIYGARVSSSGQLFDITGIPICTAGGYQRFPDVASCGTNYLVVWDDNRSSTQDIYGARVTPDGDVLDPAGIPIATEVSRSEQHPALSYDGGNYLIVWDRSGGSTTYDIYAARLSPDGTVIDPTGLSVCSSPEAQIFPSVAFDGTCYLIVWQDLRNGNWDIYGARMSPEGEVLDTEGIGISVGSGGQTSPEVVFDGATFLVLWQDDRTGFSQAYGARVASNGSVLDPTGFPISASANRQMSPAACSRANEQVLIGYSEFGSADHGSYRALGNFYEAEESAPYAPGGLVAGTQGPNSVLLCWEDNSWNEDSFEVWRKDGSDSNWALVKTLVSDTESWVNEGLIGGTPYYFRVRACNVVGCSDWSDTATATIPWPTLTNPPDRCEVAAYVDFAWCDFAGAYSYQILLSEDADLSNPVWSGTTGSLSIHYVCGPEFTPVVPHYWSVRALLSTGYSPFAPSRVITRATPASSLEAPVLNIPTDGVDIALPDRFSWTEVYGAETYLVQSSSSLDFSSVLWSTQTDAAAVVVPSSAAPSLGSTYYWRVKALGPGTESLWSEHSTFSRVGSVPLPLAPTLLSPANGSSEPGPTVAFAWDATARATAYDIWISTAHDFPPWPGATWQISDVAATSRVVPLNSRARTFYWKVAAGNSGGSGPASATWSFSYDAESVPLASCVILSPPDGISVPQDRIMTARAVVAGEFSGPVTVRWYLDDVIFVQSETEMEGQGFFTPEVQVPTSTLGSHFIYAKVTAAPTVEVQSPSVDFTVNPRVFGAPVALQLVAQRDVLIGGESTVLLCKVVDAEGRTVESDSGRVITFSESPPGSGGGSFDPEQALTYSGVAVTDYTSGVVEGSVEILASSDGLLEAREGITIVGPGAEAELQSLKVEANQYLDRLGSLEWDYYVTPTALSQSLNVAAAQTLVDEASIGDEQRLRRLNLFLRYLDRSYYHDPAKHGGHDEGHVIKGAQVMMGDLARSWGDILLTAMGALSIAHGWTKDLDPVTRWFARSTIKGVTAALDGTFKLIMQAVGDGAEKRVIADIWKTMKPVVSNILLENPEVALAELVADPVSRAATGDYALVRGFVVPSQHYLNQVVIALGDPDWSGGATDAPAQDCVQALLDTVWMRTDAQDQVFAQTLERCGLFSFFAEVFEYAALRAGGLGIIIELGAVLYRILDMAIVWGTGADCQIIGARIAGPNMQGVVARAVIADYGGTGTEWLNEAGLSMVGMGSESFGSECLTGTDSPGCLQLQQSKALGGVLTASWTAIIDFESALRDLEAGLAQADTAAVLAALQGFVADRVLVESWSQLSSVTLSTSDAGVVSIPNYPGITDSLAVQMVGAASEFSAAIGHSAEWLTASNDDGLRVLALVGVRRAIDLANGYQHDMTQFIAGLVAAPCSPCLHTEIPDAPDAIATGATGSISSVVRNIGAGTAYDIVVTIAADPFGLSVLAPDTVWVDSLVCGDSLTCSWQVEMLDSVSATDTTSIVIGSVFASSDSSLWLSSTFLISVLPRDEAGTNGPRKGSIATAIHRIWPNPSDGQQIFELSVAPGDMPAELRIYDVMGRLALRRSLGSFGSGTQLVLWDGCGIDSRPLPPGVYFAAVTMQSGMATRKLVRLK